MAICKKIVREKKRICTGSLKTRIIISLRSIKAPSFNNVDFDEEFNDIRTVWAYCETVSGLTEFDDSNIEEIVTHIFYIRYIPSININTVNWIEHRNKRYKIITVENINDENEFLLIKTNSRGLKEFNMNKS